VLSAKGRLLLRGETGTLFGEVRGARLPEMEAGLSFAMYLVS